jgi:hypothetical protein
MKQSRQSSASAVSTAETETRQPQKRTRQADILSPVQTLASRADDVPIAPRCPTSNKPGYVNYVPHYGFCYYAEKRSPILVTTAKA